MPKIFNRQQLIHNRNRASCNLASYSFLHQETGEWIIEKLTDMSRTFPNLLEIGARNGLLGQRCAKLKNSNFLVQTDIALNMSKLQVAKNRLVVDDEQLCFRKQSFDLIISNLNLHFINNVPNHLCEIKTLLKPGGLFIASFFGGETLKQLRQAFYEAEIKNHHGASPHIIPFIDIKTAGMLLQKCGFSYPVADSETIEVEYSNIHNLLHDLQNMGEGNVLLDRKHKPLSRKILAELETSYRRISTNPEKNICAQFEIITLSGWA